MQALQKQTYTTVAQMMDKSRDSIAAALPKHLTVERLTRVALGELRTNDKLLACNPASLMSAIVKASQLGLEVGSAMGHAYLVPFKTECTLIIGYRGMIALARRSGEIQSITARVVYACDLFELEYGLDEKLRHVPSTDEDPGQVTHVYAVAKLRDGGIQYEVMTRAEVEAIRKRSRASGYGPWVTDWSEMARKTVMRRLFKYLPMSIEMADALAAEADDDRPPERNVTATVTDLNARLAASVQHQPHPNNDADSGQKEADLSTTPEWPQIDPETGELIDARGIAWDERIHASSKACNDDGKWRARRGADPELIRRYEGEALARAREAASSDPQGAPPADTAAQATDETDDYRRLRDGIAASNNQDEIDTWWVFAKEIVLTPSQRAELSKLVTERKAQWRQDAGTEPSDFEKIRAGLLNAASEDEILDWWSESQNCVISQSQRYALESARDERRRQLSAAQSEA